MPDPVAILGGTGNEGRGLAARWSRAGRKVIIGSRDPERAGAAASEVAARSGGIVDGTDNNQASRSANVVVLATPFEGLEATVMANADALADKLVVSAVNPLRFAEGRISMREIAEGSAAELVAARLPQSRVATAFHNLSAVLLGKLDREPDQDIPVAADAEADRELVVELCKDLGARGVGVGPLSLARYLEGYTAVLLTVNKLHRTQAGIRLTGLP
jgi:8-hydroxy-5-deazaflavin:NADPH oxidoreductase